MRSIQFASLHRTTAKISALTLAAASLVSAIGCADDDGDDRGGGADAALSLRGTIAGSALTAEEAATATGLHAYLFWMNDQGIIDTAGLDAAVNASFRLSIGDDEQPAPTAFLPDAPDLAIAQIAAMSPSTADVFLQLMAADGNGEDGGTLAPGTVVGLTEFFVVYSRVPGALGADAFGIDGLQQGFNLVGPNLAGRACADAKWADYDVCFNEGVAACDALIAADDGTDAAFAAHDACIEDLCVDELAAVDGCGASLVVVPHETEIEVNLVAVPAASTESDVDEG